MEILNYHQLFESNSLSDIEACKDIIETFNEKGDTEFIIRGYQVGYSPSFDSEVTTSPKNESDKAVLKFILTFSTIKEFTNQLSSARAVKFSNNIPNEEIDRFIQLVNKSKIFVTRLKEYCDKINYSVINQSIHFKLLFDNNNSEIKLSAKIKRVNKGIAEYFSNYTHNKTIEISSPGGSFLLKNNIYHTLRQIINKDETTYTAYNKVQKKLGDCNYYSIRFATTIQNLVTNIITIKVHSFKCKTSDMDSYQSVRLSKEAIGEVSKIVSESLKRTHYLNIKETDNISITSEYNEVKVTINN